MQAISPEHAAPGTKRVRTVADNDAGTNRSKHNVVMGRNYSFHRHGPALFPHEQRPTNMSPCLLTGVHATHAHRVRYFFLPQTKMSWRSLLTSQYSR